MQVRRCYCNPLMEGSNSIRTILPTVLKTSKILHEKYSQLIYGSESGGLAKLINVFKKIYYNSGKNSS